MIARIVASMLGLALLGSLASAEEAAAPLQYLPPEHFSSKKAIGDYLPHAHVWLAENPTGPRAARVAYEMLMVATLLEQPSEIEAAKLRLLLDYPGSFPSTYFVKRETAGDVAKLLKAHFEDDTRTHDRAALTRFLRSVEFCLRIHGRSLFDDQLWAQSALATQDIAFSTNCQRQIQKADSDAAKTVAIVLDARLSLRDKFVELQTLRKYKTARAFQRFLLTELTEAERADPEVQVVLIENLLHEQKLAEAVPLLAALCKESRDAKHHFWRAWALAASGKTADAINALEQLQTDYPSDAWAKSAAELSKTLAHLEQSLKDHTLIADEACAALVKSPPDMLEATVLWYGEGNRITSTYVGFDAAKDAFELVSASGDDPRVAYRAGPGICQIFVAGDSQIHRYGKGGLCPICTFGLDRTKLGRNFKFNFNTAQQGAGALAKTLNSLLALPIVTSEVERRAWLADAVAGGRFPCPVTTEKGNTVLRWIEPQIDEPELRWLDIRLSPQRRLVSIQNETGSGVVDLRYGAAGALQLNSPRWPQLPVEELAELGPQEFFRVFGALTSLAMDGMASAKVAEQDAKDVR